MLLAIITYLAGVLTILSPCILPVLPFVFSKSQGSFFKNGVPLLVGMAATFSILSGIAIVGGEWVGHASEIGRTGALILLSFFGLSLIFPRLAELAVTPFTRLGTKIGAASNPDSVWGSLLIGVSTGLLWAPCAGPILGLVLTGAASQGNLGSSLVLLLSYSLGAVTSLAVVLLAGQKILGRLKQTLGADRIVRTIVGVAVLAGVSIIAFNLDRTLLTQISKVGTESVETKLLGLLNTEKEKGEPTNNSMMMSATQPTNNSMMMMSGTQNSGPAIEGLLPEFAGVTSWINSPALSVEDLRGHVVLIDFWTYSCINCLRTLPYVKAWAEKYKNDGLIVIGVHTPEFAFEKISKNVLNAVTDLGITYPVAVDSNYKIWNAFKNQYWPAHYFVDRLGRIRAHHFGEGSYDQSEGIIRDLLKENGGTLASSTVQVQASGVQAAATTTFQTPETYLGYSRADNFVGSSEIAKDKGAKYLIPKTLELNQWALEGDWMIEKERAVSKGAATKIAFRFHARDLHLVLGGPGSPIKFKVLIDGHPPGDDHGLDTDSDGQGQISGTRLYQLIRQKEDGRQEKDHTFEIEFSSPNAQAYAFTFG